MNGTIPGRCPEGACHAVIVGTQTQTWTSLILRRTGKKLSCFSAVMFLRISGSTQPVLLIEIILQLLCSMLRVLRVLPGLKPRPPRLTTKPSGPAATTPVGNGSVSITVQRAAARRSASFRHVWTRREGGAILERRRSIRKYQLH
jgi:hypothetical protein